MQHEELYEFIFILNKFARGRTPTRLLSFIHLIKIGLLIIIIDILEEVFFLHYFF